MKLRNLVSSLLLVLVFSTPTWAQDITGTARQLASQGYFDTCRAGDQHACSYFVRLVVWTLNPQGDSRLPGALRKTSGGANVNGYAEDAIALNGNPGDFNNVMDLIAGTGAPNASIRDFNLNPRRSTDIWEAPKPLTAAEMARLRPGSEPPPQPQPQPTPTPQPPAINLGPVLDSLIETRRQVQELRAQVEALRQALENSELQRASQHADLVARLTKAHEDILVAVDLGRRQLDTTYSGRAGFLGTITLRPNRP